MCDDFTVIEEEAALTALGVSRRDFAQVAAGAGLAAVAASPAYAATGVVERAVSIPTGDGQCDGFLYHPATGKHPGIIMWPDIAGLRDAYKLTAKRLAAQGYTVLLVNHYYRTAHAPILATMAEWRTPAGAEKLKPAIAALTPEKIAHDAAAFVAFLDKQAATDGKRGLGSAGYCMTGGYTVRTAAVAPHRVKACASLHGAGLVDDKPDGVIALIGKTQASFLFAIAQNDDARSPGDKVALKKACAAAGRPAEIEVYHADHGWTTLDAPSYNKAEAERAWLRILALFRKL
ncbi:MAG: dienelactone hydrolase family protein [Sphingomonadales bacterium]|nr:dienelactone hydrolase family protein [Sphingomonadales bacterium]MDE2168832.1 dienelactone hydrolase family protein [Sphingomonadales bacterium]